MLRILTLADNPSNTDLLQVTLAKGGIACEIVRVQTRVEFVAALKNDDFDLIFANYTVPSFDGLSALELAREVRPNMPFVLITGTVDNDVAIETTESSSTTDNVLNNRLERLVPAVRRTVREAEERRERAEEALQKSEERFRTLVEYASDMIVVLDAEGAVLYDSPAVERVLGFSPEEQLGTNAFNLLHPDDVEPASNRFAELLERPGERLSMEYRVRDNEETWRYLEATAINLLDDPVISGIVVSAQDITQRRQDEQRLDRQARLLDLTQDAVIEYNADGRISFWNRGAEELYGFTREEALGQIAHTLLKTRPPRPFEEIKSDLLRDGYWEGEVVHTRRDGTVVVAASRRVLECSERGEPLHVLETNHNITDRKEAEEALRHSERQFRAVFEQVPVGMVQVRLDGSWVRFNEKFCDILGYTHEELHTVDFQDILVPEDVERELERGARMLSGELRGYSEEKLIRRKDGSRAWICVTVSLVYSSSGPEHFVGVIDDITERKRIEEALNKSDILYRTVVEQAAENIFVVDLESKRILEANPALHRSLGYGPEELKDMVLYDIVAHDRESIDENTNRIIAEGHCFIGERCYRRKDGAVVDVEVSASTVPYDGREALAIVAHDLTERKKAEADLRHSLSVLLALREAGQILGSTLSSAEIVSRLLEIMRGVSSLTAAVLSMQNADGELRIWGSAGLEGLRRRDRFEQEAEVARRATLESEEPRTFRLLHGSGSENGYLVGLCLPLRIKDRVVGVLEAYGKESLVEADTIKILSSLTSQAASALENASLYEELGERERSLQDLVKKLLGAQEEERRRVAYEVHDGLAQVAVAAHQNLQAFARRHSQGTERGRKELEQILEQVRATVSDARRIIANLRPTTLDDLGLGATLSLEVEQLREDGYQVDYEEHLGDQRLLDPVDITLFRIAQEALNNVRKHAQTRQVRIRLERSENEAHLEIQDYGRGFDPVQASAGSGPGERVGLAGMRERVSMLGGELEIESHPDTGTSIVVTVPLMRSS